MTSIPRTLHAVLRRNAGADPSAAEAPPTPAETAAAGLLVRLLSRREAEAPPEVEAPPAPRRKAPSPAWWKAQSFANDTARAVKVEGKLARKLESDPFVQRLSRLR